MSEDEPTWEVLKLPPELEIANKNKQSASPKPQENNTKDDGKERLCGYLNKLGAKGIKTWKKRWFVFEPRRCTLYYYRTPDCTDPLGNIDIANATFSVPVNPSIKGQFEIRSVERVYYLQAADKETVQFWLQQLKAERAKFMRLQSNISSDSKLTGSSMRPTSGLLSTSSDQGNDQDNADDLILFAEPVKKPATVGEAAKSESSPSLSNLSISNLKTELKNWRKSGLFNSVPTGDALKNDNDERSLPTVHEKTYAQKSVRLREGRASRSVDFGFQQMSAALKRRTFWWNHAPSVEQEYGRDTPETCRDCEEVKGILSTLKEAIQIAEKEIKTRDEVIENLHEQIRYAVTTKPVDHTSANNDPESVEEKDNYIGQLSNIVRNLKGENEVLQTKLEDKENQLTEVNAKIDVLQELVTNKDTEIIRLTNQIFTIEHPETAEDACEEDPESLENEPQPAPILDKDQLKEMCNAYKEQNKLLNSEILELMKLRRRDKEIIKNKDVTITTLDAELCKTKSRYVLLLKEYSVPHKGKERDQEMIQHLLDDAINQEIGIGKSPTAIRSVDRYGFYEIVDTEDGDALLTYSERLDEKSSDNMPGSHDMSAGVKWENFLVAQGTKQILRSEEVKALIRGGIPHEFRARVWRDVINYYVKHEREAAGEGYFHSLLEDRKDLYTPAKKQIELDLLRTLPNNKFYDRVDSEGTSKLRRVLLAYSWHNAKVGYCQGLNRLGAIALLYLEEEDAFWCLVAIIEHLMPREYYNKSLTDAQVDQRVFKELFEEKLPKLSQLFQNLYVDLSLLSFNWFLAVFVDVFPIELTLRVWDAFLYEGNKVLFRYSLAIFKSCEEDLLKLEDSGAVYKFFRRIPSHRMNPHRISQIAFQQMNPFPKRNIITKRNQHKPKLEAELRAFEELRRYSSEREIETDSIFSDGEDED